jgi:hypothetical protein
MTTTSMAATTMGTRAATICPIVRRSCRSPRHRASADQTGGRPCHHLHAVLPEGGAADLQSLLSAHLGHKVATCDAGQRECDDDLRLLRVLSPHNAVWPVLFWSVAHSGSSK